MAKINSSIDERKIRQTSLGFFKPAKETEATVIEDNYEGYSEKEKEEEEPCVIDDDFMKQLKGLQVADVNDSDDECYF
jgi:hypothetical protein